MQLSQRHMPGSRSRWRCRCRCWYPSQSCSCCRIGTWRLQAGKLSAASGLGWLTDSSTCQGRELWMLADPDWTQTRASTAARHTIARTHTCSLTHEQPHKRRAELSARKSMLWFFILYAYISRVSTSLALARFQSLLVYCAIRCQSRKLRVMQHRIEKQSSKTFFGAYTIEHN